MSLTKYDIKGAEEMVPWQIDKMVKWTWGMYTIH